MFESSFLFLELLFCFLYPKFLRSFDSIKYEKHLVSLESVESLPNSGLVGVKPKEELQQSTSMETSL